MRFGDLLARPRSGSLFGWVTVLVYLQHRDVSDAVLGKPPLAVGVVRHSPRQTRPELLAMIMLSQMDEFLDDDILDDARGQADRAPVEVQVTGRAAGAPAVAEIYHPDRAVGCASARSVKVAPLTTAHVAKAASRSAPNASRARLLLLRTPLMSPWYRGGASHATRMLWRGCAWRRLAGEAGRRGFGG